MASLDPLCLEPRPHLRHGRFLALEARALGGAASELHYEETNWQARPDLSPDGHRIVYSSYLGRNWLQLWVMPGGRRRAIADFLWRLGRRQPALVTRTDARSPSSPTTTAGTDCCCSTVPGGATRSLTATSRSGCAPTAQLLIRSRTARAARRRAFAVTDADGRFHAPAAAWIHADDGFDRDEQPFEAHYFHTGGTLLIEVPAGTVTSKS